MGKNYYLLIFLFIGVCGNSQIINFTDPALKNRLVNTNCASFDQNPNYTNDADTNNDGEIQISEANAVLGLDISSGGISSIGGLENFTQLYRLLCNGNQITSLDLSFCTDNIWEIDVSGNPLTSLILPPYYLHDLTVDNTALTHLEFSCGVQNDDSWISISNNPNLVSINAKNGFLENTEGGASISVGNNPMLQYICVDDISLWISGPDYWQIDSQTWQWAVGNNPNVQISSYCNFAPGGSYNILSGNIMLDCGGSNTNINDVGMNVAQGVQGGTTFSNGLGNYFFYAGLGLLTVTPELNPLYFTATPPNFTYDFTGYGNDIDADFCIVANGSHNDVEVSIVEVFPARPGFNTIYKLICRNIGTEPANGMLNFLYNESLLDFVSAIPSATSTASGTVSWAFSNLPPLTTIEYLVTLNANSPTETPPVNIGDILISGAEAQLTASDEDLTNNNYTFNQTVIGSYDPNDKAVQQVTITPSQTDEYLNYVIRFQNTGTYLAENVVVKDSLSLKLDRSTWEVVSASHPYRAVQTKGYKLEFIFEGINLPAVGDDEPGSHGYIAFRIKPANSVGLGSVIDNKANIYFDYNWPIVTNTVTTTVTALQTPEFDPNAFTVAPNPATNSISLKTNENTIIESVVFYNVLGQRVFIIDAPTQEILDHINIETLHAGTYFVEINSDKGKTVKKLIKNN